MPIRHPPRKSRRKIGRQSGDGPVAVGRHLARHGFTRLGTNRPPSGAKKTIRDLWGRKRHFAPALARERDRDAWFHFLNDIANLRGHSFLPMGKLQERAFRITNAALIGALVGLHRLFGVETIYRIGHHGVAALFEDNWFAYSLKEFGCTGNVDYAQDAENMTRHELFKRIRPSDVVYDIGAHGGVYSVTLKSRFPKSQVFSFEPQPEDLLVNLRLNQMATDNVHEIAVGNIVGVVRMTTRERSSNHVNIAGDREVRMVRLDEYTAAQNIPDPDWIKIDIEGMELPALIGAEALIRRSRPTIICEINHLHNRFGTTVPDILRWLRSVDYEAHRLTGNSLIPIPGAIDFASLGYSADRNFWFMPASRQ
ncbi:hypothetical protein SKP52_11700 [Sphingopyxis fribergensis]|uniref:Methyltransferase FkbM domain-containing protein n=1 Tax=Sphingopyxis fribergensis TaxID=1515612 RepID=A0A0A7PMX5_9SPHN|nr:hypothetical protein SKP52_11700 [Sphingopyxis fribergensis]